MIDQSAATEDEVNRSLDVAIAIVMPTIVVEESIVGVLE